MCSGGLRRVTTSDARVTMPLAGFEPTRIFQHLPLKQTCIPIPSQRLKMLSCDLMRDTTALSQHSHSLHNYHAWIGNNLIYQAEIKFWSPLHRFTSNLPQTTIAQQSFKGL